jgi:hypothetical protein
MIDRVAPTAGSSTHGPCITWPDLKDLFRGGTLIGLRGGLFLIFKQIKMERFLGG